MMTVHLTPIEVLAGLGGLLAFVFVWRTSIRAGRRAAETTRAGARLMSLTGRVGLAAAAIVGVQWIVAVFQRDNTWLLLVVLGLPALFASYTLTRALTVSAADTPRRKGGRR